jgi:hypothetical protein
VSKGEGLGQLTERVNGTFDDANRTRAARIAQTETLSALNQSAYEYANALPDGTVGSKTWLSHHDDRTRPAHRIADQQTVPLRAPFYVGGAPLRFPGDWTMGAPPGDIINCRCAVEYAPPGVEPGNFKGLAASYAKSKAMQLGTSLSPAAQSYLNEAMGAPTGQQ